jgi:hypothetical protein
MDSLWIYSFCVLHVYLSILNILFIIINVGQSDETKGGPSGEMNITPGSIQAEPRNTSNPFIPDQLMHVSP